MKKRLLIMRHSKADRDEKRWQDFDRPLNERGRRDAKTMGRWLKQQGLLADYWIASPAVRTHETARLLAHELDFKGRIDLQSSLYEGSSLDYLAQIRLCPASTSTLLIVGHNPALEQLVESLSGESQLLKTSAVACLAFHAPDWSESSPDSFQFVDLWTPDSVE